MKLLIIVLIVCAVKAKPTPGEFDDFGDKNIPETHSAPPCYDTVCPSGTAACSKTSKTSEDRKTIVTTVQCEDTHGNVLKTDSSTSRNPNEHTVIQTFSFSGVYHGGNAGKVSRNFGSHNTFNTNNDEIETF